MDYNLVLTWKGKNKLVLVYKKRGLLVCLFVCFFCGKTTRDKSYEMKLTC